jgi:hypothetical protein
MARISLSKVVFLGIPLGLLTWVTGYVLYYLFAFAAASSSPGEIVGGSIQILANPKLTWTQVGSTQQYYATLPSGYVIDQFTTDGVRGVKSPIPVQGGWKVVLSSRNYAEAVSICSDATCSLSPVANQHIYANLSSANLVWEPASGANGTHELHFHDKACDDYPTTNKEDRKCDFLSTVVISDSTHSSLASGKCSRFPILLDGYCDINIGAPMP